VTVKGGDGRGDTDAPAPGASQENHLLTTDSGVNDTLRVGFRGADEGTRGHMTTTLDRPRPGIGNDLHTRRWQRHPVLAFLLKSAVLAVPLAFAAVVGLVAGWSVHGDGVGDVLLRVGVAGVASVLAFALVERLARRFLPLAMLLKLSLVFPDQAPSRFSVALRSTSVKKLQQWARTTQHDDGLGALAEKVVTLAAALNTHDRRTRGHSDRTRSMAELIAVEMGLPESEVNEVRWGAFLHDIGKILVPADLLNKPGKPTPDEWEALKRHPADGGNLVEPLRSFLGSGIEAVSEHHENFDGSGYPRGLAGGDIALSARIVSVADSFEVMTAVRSYSKPKSASDARRELARHSGTQFDPDVVRALFNVSLGRLHWSMGLAAWAADLPFLGVLPRAVAQAGALGAGSSVSVGTLAGVAAISLGSMAIHAPLPSTPVTATIPVTGAQVASVSGRPTITRQSTGAVGAASPAGPSTAGTPSASPAPGATASGTTAEGGTGAPPAAGTSGTGTESAPGVPSSQVVSSTAPDATQAAALPPEATTPTLPPQAAPEAATPPGPPDATSPTLPPQAATPPGPPDATSPTLPPQAATPPVPPQATRPTLPPQAKSPRNP
jgi:hypothetical protein